MTAEGAPVEATQTLEVKQPTHFEIRRYVPVDHEQVTKLFADGMMMYTEESHPHYEVWVNYVTNSLATDLSDIPSTYLIEGCEFFIVEATGPSSASSPTDGAETKVIVGTIGIQKRSETVAELRRVSVKAEYRRFGIGRMLMVHATKWAQGHGYSKLILSTAASQYLAIKFYEKLGYKFTRTSVMVHDPHFELAHFEKDI
uniref:N-acetyltransferase domain-containing protein n=1 Tax=Globisporangium ultimum (strain ATCC 200006 / CBS 805.95 / DAOM BR144) TaxID=431595 RepID=K3XAQ6_GLOUD